ncbi:MAG TPA: ATP-binding protein [Flavisolibacter sp.]|nr:ATP-binding protein [Flavisolibacter sp.]
MLFPGTQMHMVTFLFVCIEIVILFYLFIYKLGRPDDKTTALNVVLISLLLAYNVTGGLLPDDNLPGSYYLQMSVAYGTGFITPCYFPYYVYRAFGLVMMRFHAFKGVFACLIVPYIVFVVVFAFTGSLEQAKNILAIPTLYALWVIFTLNKAVNFKYQNDFSTSEAKQEKYVLLLSLTPWVGLPIIDFLNFGQVVEASITNLGFLTLFFFQVKEHIAAIRLEHRRVVESEQRLKSWNTTLQTEVEKRTKDLAKINEQQMNTFINLAHETKTPLTLVNNYMDDYIAHHGNSEELSVVKSNLDKLSADIVNLFDLEKFKKGFAVYNHNQICNFSKVLFDSVALFKVFVAQHGIVINAKIEEDIYIKADPLSINRIINNLMENAIKFSPENGVIDVVFSKEEKQIFLRIKDQGPGIPAKMQSKVFEPYYQLVNQKKNSQGMGLGLSIVKKVLEDVGGTIQIFSDPEKTTGTEMVVCLNCHSLLESEKVDEIEVRPMVHSTAYETKTENFFKDSSHKTIMIVEDNKSLLSYVVKKLKNEYNVIPAINGSEALKKLNSVGFLPDLIISDVMMDKLDGFSLAGILAKNETYEHVPFIFLTAKFTPADRLKGLRLGALDFIQKPFLMPELLQKIHSILTTSERQRRAFISSLTPASKVANATNSQAAEQSFERNAKRFQLTSRETEIAQLVCVGRNNKVIGEALFISEKTVAKHVQNIFEKVGVSTRMELMNRMGEHGKAL